MENCLSRVMLALGKFLISHFSFTASRSDAVVEAAGVEPAASSLQSWRSTN